ncbi:MAG TPA: acetyl-CoA carboxylase, carboxyltransferase subunit beta [Bdellovibrionota bacterium]|nr:acetyl-CoA carboxylase, carboxyltransferase subunit beta [Bdellovibrionota bacterium]
MSWIDKLKAPKISTSSDQKSSFPEGLWAKCPGCSEILLQDDINKNLSVCPKCQYHFRMKSSDRLNVILEPGSFEELDADMEPTDPLDFKDHKRYRDRIKALEKTLPAKEAFVYGRGLIHELPIVVGSFVFEYMGGSMGSVVGEKLTRTFELAALERKPCLVITSSGGARMQEGILSLMQMAKSTAALGRLRKQGIPYAALLTDPTTGGVAASCAMLGDVILAEPNALIGFAGPRVIQQTIKETLPEGFQKSEFLLAHGMLDRIISRAEMKGILYKLLSLLSKAPPRLDARP